MATVEDLQGLANLVRGRDIAVFSDEPYCHMVWSGQHQPLLAQPGMLDQTVAAYTFSKSYSMSGWRLGYAVCSTAVAGMIGKMINTSLSCVPPLVQLAGQAALESRCRRARRGDAAVPQEGRAAGGGPAPGRRTCSVLMPAGTFYVFPDVSAICKRLGIQSHGLAMYLLEGADDCKGVACLGGECFGSAGQGFLRFSCAEPDERLHEAVAFLAEAVTRTDRVQKYVAEHPRYRLGLANC